MPAAPPPYPPFANIADLDYAPPTPERPWHTYNVTAADPPCLAEGRHWSSGWRERTVTGVPIGDRRVQIVLRQRRCRTRGCVECTELPWLDPLHPGYTREAIDFAIRVGLRAPFVQVAKRLGCTDTLVGRLCRPVMIRLAHGYRPRAPRMLVIDECHFGNSKTSRRQHLVLVDADGPAGESLIEIGADDSNAELRRLLLSLEHRERIVAVALDGCRRYAEVVREVLGPGVAIVYDRWHFREDCLAIPRAAWRGWRERHRSGRTPEVRLALQVDLDLINSHPGTLSRARSAALAALKQQAPHVAALHQWAHDQITFYHAGADAAASLEAARRTGRALLRRHRENLPERVAQDMDGLLTRITRRRADLLAYLDYTLARPPRRKGEAARSVGLTTGRAEGYNRYLAKLNNDALGLEFDALRIKALVRYGPISDAMIMEAAALPAEPLAWPRRHIPPAPVQPRQRAVKRSSPDQMELLF